jgi:hypothetical protein
MPMPGVSDLWQEATAVAVLLLILYSGHRGWFYWSPGVKALALELARERDDWRAIAVTLLRKQGVDLPEGFERGASIVLPGDDVTLTERRRRP